MRDKRQPCSETRNLVLKMAPAQSVLEMLSLEMKSSSEFEIQEYFASILIECWSSEFAVSRRYLKHLLRKYISDHIVNENFESDALLEILNDTLRCGDDQVSSDESCYVYVMPEHEIALRIRIYPTHNDVALRIWEAGAYLAEYLIANCNLVRDRSVLELGAGTGVTGLLLAGLAGAKEVLCSDFTDMCLQNMDHNISINNEWLLDQGQRPEAVSSGYLEWGEFAERETFEEGSFYARAERCDTLIAADVIYDPTAIPSLVAAIQRFNRGRSGDKPKTIILGATRRNMATFDLLMSELEQYSLEADLLSNDCNSIPFLFSMMFNQPRSDVMIYRLKCI